MSSPGIPNDGSRFWVSRGPELTAALTTTMTQIRTLYADALDLVAELDEERVAQDAGYSSLAAFLVETLRVTPHKAARMIAQATQVAETVTPTGHVTPAALPHIRAAVLEGAVDGEHIDAVADILKKVADLGQCGRPRPRREDLGRAGPGLAPDGGAPRG